MIESRYYGYLIDEEKLLKLPELLPTIEVPIRKNFNFKREIYHLLGDSNVKVLRISAEIGLYGKCNNRFFYFSNEKDMKRLIKDICYLIIEKEYSNKEIKFKS